MVPGQSVAQALRTTPDGLRTALRSRNPASKEPSPIARALRQSRSVRFERSAGKKAKADFTAQEHPGGEPLVNNSEHQTSPRSPLRGSTSTLDRRGGASWGSQPAPLLVLARYRTSEIIPSPGNQNMGLKRLAYSEPFGVFFP